MESTTTSDKVSQYTDFGYVEGGQVYRKGLAGRPDFVIGVVKETEEQAIAYFTKRFSFLEGKIAELENTVSDAYNKGSFLVKLLYMHQQLDTFTALGNYQPLYDRLDTLQASIRGMIVVNRVKNLEIKRALLQDLKDALEDPQDWKAVADQLKDLREKWVRTGPIDPEFEDEVEKGFEAVLDAYYLQRKIYYDQRAKLLVERLEAYTVLVDKAKALSTSDLQPGNAMRQYKTLQDAWKDVGNVPKIHFEPLVVAFKEIGKQVTRTFRHHKNKQSRINATPAQLEAMRQKQELIVKVIALQQIDLKTAFGEARNLQLVWKTIAEVPEYKKRDLNERFTLACDRIFEMSALMRTIYTTYRFFNSKPLKEQVQIKIETLRQFYAKAAEELIDFEAELNAIPFDDKALPASKAIYGKVMGTRRRQLVKLQLVAELEAQIQEAN